MRATIRDTYNALTWRNLATFGVIIAVATFLSVTVSLPWRRFIAPGVIFSVAALGWKIARTVNEEGLSQLINAASVSLAGFAVALYIGATVDSQIFPVTGYITGDIQIIMWSWIAVHLSRALSILRHLSPVGQKLLTQSTATIVAQMRHRHTQINAALEQYEEVRGAR